MLVLLLDDFRSWRYQVSHFFCSSYQFTFLFLSTNTVVTIFPVSSIVLICSCFSAQAIHDFHIQLGRLWSEKGLWPQEQIGAEIQPVLHDLYILKQRYVHLKEGSPFFFSVAYKDTVWISSKQLQNPSTLVTSLMIPVLRTPGSHIITPSANIRALEVSSVIQRVGSYLEPGAWMHLRPLPICLPHSPQ